MIKIPWVRWAINLLPNFSAKGKTPMILFRFICWSS
jgi:hypothetical protein